MALPSDKAALIALRTQQVLAHETGVTNTIDPLAGSYFVEALTDKMENDIEEMLAEIEHRGGVIKCIEEGFLQREIAKSAYRYQQEIERKERIIVGINDYIMKDEKIEIPILKIDESVETEQKKILKQIRERRDNDKVKRTLDDLVQVCKNGDNTLKAILECVRVMGTVGEISDAMKTVFGEYHEPPVI